MRGGRKMNSDEMLTNKKMAATRLIILGILGVNSILSHFGYNPIPVSEEIVYQAVSDLVLFGTMFYAAYKNNDTTDEAVAGTAVMKSMKNESLNKDERKALLEAKRKI